MPVTQEMTPVLTVEVWEHAYCLDCQNQRVDHVNAIIDKLLNWELALQNAGLIVLAAFDSQRREAFACSPRNTGSGDSIFQ